MTRLRALLKTEFIIVKPDMALRTSSVYEHSNIGLTSRSPKVNIRNIEALIARFPTGSWFGDNRLEEVVIPGYPVLQRLVTDLREEATVAMMTGSGAAVFAVFGDHDRQEQARRESSRPGLFVRTVWPHPAGVVVKEDG